MWDSIVYYLNGIFRVFFAGKLTGLCPNIYAKCCLQSKQAKGKYGKQE